MRLIDQSDVRARKSHTCDSCLRPIEVGTVHMRQNISEDGTVRTFRTHLACDEAIRIVVDEWEAVDLEDGWPRVVDLEREDVETVRARNPELAREVFGEET